MDKKQYRLIQYLSRNRAFNSTLEQLSLFLGVSNRTVIRYINGINDNVNSNTFEIISEYGKGYRLIVKDEHSLYDYVSRISEFNDLQRYILISIFREDKLQVEYLESRFFLSKASVLRDIDRLDALIHELYGVNIKYENEAFILYGNELMIRNLLHDVFTKNDEISNVLPLYQMEYYNSIYRYLQLADNSSKEKRVIIQQSNYIFISVLRSLNGNIIQDSEALNLMAMRDSSEILLTVRNLKKSLEKKFTININNNELKYWLVILAADRINVHELNVDSVKKISNIVSVVLKDIDSKFGFKLSEDAKLNNNLIYHIITSLSGYILNSKTSVIDNSKLQEIKASQRLAYFFSVEFCNFLSSKLEITIQPEEIDYITLHFATSLASNLKTDVYSLALDIDESKGVKEYVKMILNNSLERGKITNFVDSNSDFEVANYDYILTDKHAKSNKYIRFDYKNMDTAALDIEIQLQNSRNILEHYLKRENYISNLESEDRFETIELIGEELISNNLIRDEEIDRFIEREFKSSTVISQNIAMPHAIIEGESFIYIAKLKNAINWKNNIVSLIIIVGLKDGEVKNKELVESVLFICKHTDLNNKLMTVDSFEEMYELIIKS